MIKTIDRALPDSKNSRPEVVDEVKMAEDSGLTSFNLLGEGENAPDPRDWLAAIIEGSDDAIVSKDLDGKIQSWNAGATRLFGYTVQEVIGRPVTLLIPDDRLDEEPAILAQIREGKRVEHFETVRRRKDGVLVEISLTISPIRNVHGVIIGASKIARDMTSRRRAHEQQQLLIGEMHHRVKNLFALASAIVSLSMRSGASAEEVPKLIQARLGSLSRAHDLTMVSWQEEGAGIRDTDFKTLVRTILDPYNTAGERICIAGDNPPVGGKSLTNLALFLHELATNSAKYGALSVVDGHLDLQVNESEGDIELIWTETGGPQVAASKDLGFGSRLERGLASALGATIEREWRPAGVVVRLRAPRAKFTGSNQLVARQSACS